MLGSELRKQCYWQLRDFRHCDPDKYKETTVPQRQFIYLFKRDNPQIVARICEPLEKIHCYTFREIEILQQLNDNPKVFHWKHLVLPFRGELILSILEDFNKSLRDELETAIPRKTKALQRWLAAPLDDVFLITIKSQQSFGNEHAFLQIKTLYRTRYKNYFQMRSWRSKSWQGLLDIANDAGITKNSSYGLHLDEINSFIGDFEVINNQHYEDMFALHSKKKAVKERPKDRHQMEYERKILLKYGLTQYIDKRQ